MQIVTDSGADLSPAQRQGIEVHSVPLVITLEGKSYRSGIDIQPEEFYQMLANTKNFPTTSQPSPAEFADLYRKVAETDPDILSVHISSGLSGTLNAARLGATMVPEANVTFVDTKTLSGGEGWQVEAAARAILLGWPLDRIVAALQKISDATDVIYTLATLRYLIHGGRISHIRGLLGQLLEIKPAIGVDKTDGKYAQRGSARTLTKAIKMLPDLIARQHAPGTELRAQIVHGDNPEGVALLKEALEAQFTIQWVPTMAVAPVLGAHTGPGLIGVGYGAAADYADIDELLRR
ncbi:MAG TPA: DegV family protein [Candidatus Limnocylindrales bacterium]|nr:DegV family protein [Candidatus Limnocylindrales bacterium]